MKDHMRVSRREGELTVAQGPHRKLLTDAELKIAGQMLRKSTGLVSGAAGEMPNVI